MYHTYLEINLTLDTGAETKESTHSSRRSVINEQFDDLRAILLNQRFTLGANARGQNVTNFLNCLLDLLLQIIQQISQFTT